jgi:hypothetical protein
VYNGEMSSRNEHVIDIGWGFTLYFISCSVSLVRFSTRHQRRPTQDHIKLFVRKSNWELYWSPLYIGAASYMWKRVDREGKCQIQFLAGSNSQAVLCVPFETGRLGLQIVRNAWFLYRRWDWSVLYREGLCQHGDGFVIVVMNLSCNALMI